MEDHRQQAIDALEAVHTKTTRGNLPMKPEGHVTMMATVAQTHALLYVGDMIAEMNDRSAVPA